MNRATEALSEQILLLSDEQLAEVNQFVEALQRGGDRMAAQTSAALSDRSFEAVWNNPEDDVYDDL